MRNNKTLFITQSAIIAAIYTVLVVIAAPISYGPIQVRFAEALTIMPYFTPAAIPGVTIGCFLSAFLTHADIIDMVFGSLATLIAALISYQLRRYKYLMPVPPILSNAIIIPWVLRYAYDIKDAIPYLMLTVGIGELIAAGVLGMILLFSLEKVKHVIFKFN